MKIKQLTFKDWIKKTGDEKIAKALGVNITTVGHWRRGHCRPKTNQLQEIKKLSKGRVSYASIIEGEIR